MMLYVCVYTAVIIEMTEKYSISNFLLSSLFPSTTQPQEQVLRKAGTVKQEWTVLIDIATEENIYKHNTNTSVFK